MMSDPRHDALFPLDPWAAALEKYASVTHLTVHVYDTEARPVLGPIHPTPLFQFIHERGYDPQILEECARRCLAQTDQRPVVTFMQVHGLTAIGTSLLLNGKIVGAAVGGYAFSDFMQASEIQWLARQAGIAFTSLWDVVRRQSPVSQRRLREHGELLQVLGDALLRENYRTRQYKRAEEALHQLNNALESRVETRTQELTESQQLLRALAAELNLTEQRERQRLAADLHDYLGQLLALNRMKLDQAKRHPMDKALRKLLDEMLDVSDKALAYARTLITYLCPPVLQEFGLLMALRWLAEQMHQRDLTVVVEARTEMPSVPEDQALLLFQSVRELLMNCIKHAGVHEATIVVEQIDGVLRIAVSDKGCGMESRSEDSDSQGVDAAKTAAAPGYGLFSIRERMLSLGGRFDLESAPGKGTVATLTMPFAHPTVDSSMTDTEGTTVNQSFGMNGPVNKKTERVRGSIGSQESTIRVLVTDDHAMVRQGLCSVLDQYSEIQVVAEAANGEEAVALADQLKPDIVLMDVTMPKMDGIEATGLITRAHPGMVVIGLSVHTATQVGAAMMEAGASAFLNKEAAVDHLYQTIHAAQQRSALKAV